MNTLTAWMSRIARLQAQKPWLLLTVCVAFAILSGLRARGLELRTRFDQLLPDSQPSVIEIRRVVARTSSATNVYVVLEGNDTKELRTFADQLLPPLRALGPEYVSNAASGVQGPRSFLLARAGLFQPIEELKKLRADVEARWDWEVAKADGSLLDEGAPPPPLSAEELKKRFDKDNKSGDTSYPDGYFQSKDGRAIVVLVATPVVAGELERGERTLARVKAVVAQTKGSRFDSVRVGYAGDLVTGLAEYGAVQRDLVQVGALGVGLVLGVVFLYFLRFRALLVTGVTIFVGLAWTFGMTAVTIGHLNVATGFLFSIIAGNGINSSIVWLQRYYEERRGGRGAEEAIVIAQTKTWLSTLVAALAAAAAYGSMVVTDFRGFKHFALIGSAGMIFCWLATMLVLPSMVALFDGGRFETTEGGSWLSRVRRGGIPFQAPLTWAVRAAPRGLAFGGALAGVAGLVACVFYVRRDPMEYNMRRLQNDLGGGSEMYRVSKIAETILGAKLESSMVVLVDRLEQVKLLKTTLEAKRDAAPANDRPLEAVHTLLDFVPDDQAAKIPELEAIAEKMRRARARNIVNDADWKELEPFLPPDDLAPFGIKDLPEELARSFTEKDGTRGRLVLVEPTAGKNDSDLRYLLEYADAFRETKLPDGSVVLGSGRAVIFADILAAVQADMPKAILVALAMTALVVLLTFRGARKPGEPNFALMVLGSLAVGLSMLALFLFLLQIKINFFNFIALPITFGIGVDYAVNLVQRYAADGERRSILAAMQTTGGAVVLNSLTTVLGYIALIGSINQAIRSLGVVAVMGELTCLVSAMLVLAGALRMRETVAAKAP